ncbi:MAG: hypothetical protein SP1CHLAM54_05630 [Chlamydiia bacterium]|nr:hypothetical protein [Chlamydiia bacterium]MCH9615473.1 hypothetical protein [Chlamydiia bacterium]MCH9629128.1 hypothetical protein [Chlamydiia bacterium]
MTVDGYFILDPQLRSSAEFSRVSIRGMMVLKMGEGCQYTISLVHLRHLDMTSLTARIDGLQLRLCAVGMRPTWLLEREITYIRPLLSSKEKVTLVNPKVVLRDGVRGILLGSDFIPLSEMKDELRENNFHSVFVHRSILYNIPQHTWARLERVRRDWNKEAKSMIPGLDFSGMTVHKDKQKAETAEDEGSFFNYTLVTFCVLGVAFVLRCMFSSDPELQ